MLRRKFTDREKVGILYLGCRISKDVDQELGGLVMQLALTDAVLPKIHDRLNVLGEFEGADALRKLVTQ